jgi:hypothetical protein
MRDYNAIAEKKGKDWAVIAQYEHAGYERGAVISVHKSYDLAAAAAKKSGYDSFRAVRNLRD